MPNFFYGHDGLTTCADTGSTHTGERRAWTQEEDQFLLQAVKEHGNANWTVIARLLKGRQPKQCRQRYFNKVDPALSSKGWTDEEDKKIVAAQSRLGNRFAEIARYLNGRSESLVSHRWHFVLSRRAQDMLNEMTADDLAFVQDIPEEPKKERRQRSIWTQDEDQKLLNLVAELGQGNWPNIAYHLPGRQPKQCRDRFVNKIDPNLRKGGWTAEEDKMIVAAHMRLGNRWHEMAKAIPGRSELQIKDRWYAVVQPKADMIAKDLTGAFPSRKNVMAESPSRGCFTARRGAVGFFLRFLDGGEARVPIFAAVPVLRCVAACPCVLLRLGTDICVLPRRHAPSLLPFLSISRHSFAASIGMRVCVFECSGLSA